MATLKNHPGFWLRDDAAAAFNAAEDAHGVFTVNDAGRTVAEQQELINRWDRGGASNRPPYLYSPARPATASNHVRNGGAAVDVGDYHRFRAVCEQYGFRWFGSSDPVHFDYVGGGSGWNRTNRSTADIQRVIGANPDGVHGPETDGKLRAWQKANGLEADGIFGAQSEAKAFPPAPAPSAWNPFGIGFCAGLQKIAKLYGYTGAIDQIWGAGSAAGFAQFLRQNWGYVGNNELGPVMWAAIARWLRARWGYVGNDEPGPLMRAALQRAETANFNEL